MSFVVHKSVLPPTGVDSCVSCFFTHPKSPSLSVVRDDDDSSENNTNEIVGDENVVVASGNRLTIYSVSRGRREDEDEDEDEDDARKNKNARLEVISEFDVNGTISDLCVLKHPKRILSEENFGSVLRESSTNKKNNNGKSKENNNDATKTTQYLDALLVTIRESKAVCVCWDPETRKCVSTSLHFWEEFAGAKGGNSLQGSATTGVDGTSSGLRIGNVPIIGRADPEGRCAAVLLRNEEKAKVKIMPASETNSNNRKKMTSNETGGTVYVPATLGSSFDLDVRKILGPSAAFVRDCCFLHGYGEPVLVILYESNPPTWSGRLSLRMDTCKLVAVSIDCTKKKYTIVWTREKLPSSTYSLFPVPNPLGGVIVLSSGHILYESQSSSATYISDFLGKGGPQEGNFAEEIARNNGVEGQAAHANPVPHVNSNKNVSSYETSQNEFQVQLDAAKIEMIRENVAIISSKTGQLITVILETVGGSASTGSKVGRRCRRIRVQKSGNAVLSSGLAAVGKDLLFIGSRVGDSLLIAYEKKEKAKIGDLKMLPEMEKQGLTEEKVEEDEAEKEEEEDDDDPYVDPEENERKRKASKGKGSVPKIAKKLAATPPAPEPTTDEEKEKNEDDELEALLYGTSVEAAGGAGLNEYERTNKSTTTTTGVESKTFASYVDRDDTFEYKFSVKDSLLCISPVVDLTVGASAPVGTDLDPRTELVAACGHGKNGALAILTRGITPELVTEVESGALPGLRACWATRTEDDNDGTVRPKRKDELFDEHLILSLASTKTTMVLETGEELREVSKEVDFVVDEETLACGRIFNGRAIAQVTKTKIRFTRKGKKFTADDISLAFLKGGDAQIASAVIQNDAIALRLSDNSIKIILGNSETNTFTLLEKCGELFAPDDHSNTGNDVTAFTLYDDSVACADSLGASGSNRAPGWLERAARGDREENDENNVVFATVSRDGTLDLYSLPSLKKLWTSGGVSDGREILAPNSPGMDSINFKDFESSEAEKYTVSDIRLDAFANAAHERPLLTCFRADGAVLAYQAFKSPSSNELRFARVPIEIETAGSELTNNDVSVQGGSRLTRVENIGDGRGIAGVFVSGLNPIWLIVRRGRVLALPTRGEGGARIAFAPFHNVNCPKGFILATNEGGIRVCRLPGKMHIEAQWPVRKLALRCTPRAITYMNDFKLYALVTSSYIPWKDFDIDETDSHARALYRFRKEKAKSEGNIVQQFAIRLLVPGTLETAWQKAVEPGEHILCVKNVQIRDQSTGALLSMLAIGTAMPGGEDTPCRGRILLFAIMWERARDGGVRWRGELKCEKPSKMACSAIESVDGTLMVAIGTKLTAHTWDGKHLNPVAFYDTPLYTTTLCCVKNFLLCGDLHKSIRFVRWKDAQGEKTLSQLGKDYEVLDCIASEFMIDGGSLSLLAADANGNAHVFQYAPKLAESWKGDKLLPKAAYHAGSLIRKMVRFQIGTGEQKQNRHAVFFGSSDGGLGIFSPVDEHTFLNLEKLQDAMRSNIVASSNSINPFGLNSKTYRALKSSEGSVARQTPPRTIVDGGLLSKFEHSLSISAQTQVAAQAGLNRDQALSLARTIIAEQSFM